LFDIWQIVTLFNYTTILTVQRVAAAIGCGMRNRLSWSQIHSIHGVVFRSRSQCATIPGNLVIGRKKQVLASTTDNHCLFDPPSDSHDRLLSTDALEAVTHVNGTARIQTVSPESNIQMHKLLEAFKLRTGYGILCNTSLNFKRRGFINNIADLSAYTIKHGLDGFVIEGRSYMLKSSENYQAYLKLPNYISIST